MPIRLSIDTEHRLVRVEVWDTFSLDEILEAIGKGIADPAFEPGFDVLSDHTRVTQYLTGDQARTLSGQMSALSHHLANARWAVVTRQMASYGMMRMVAAHIQKVPMEMEIFESTEAAEEWLSEAR